MQKIQNIMTERRLSFNMVWLLAMHKAAGELGHHTSQDKLVDFINLRFQPQWKFQ
jgi:hypothetical protein